jgi:hypothetical protein
LTGLAEFGVCSIDNVDVIQLKWLIKELDRPLHCIKNLGCCTTCGTSTKLQALAGCNPVEGGHQFSLDSLKVDARH